jgi:hypothetical protein
LPFKKELVHSFEGHKIALPNMIENDAVRAAAEARRTSLDNESGRERAIPIELRTINENEAVIEAEPEEKKTPAGLQVC